MNSRNKQDLNGNKLEKDEDEIVLYQQPETNPNNEVKEATFEEEKDYSEQKQLREEEDKGI